MADSNLSVKITADIVDLTAKSAIANANFKEMQANLRATAKAALELGQADAAASQAVLQAAENAARANAQYRATKGALDEASGATSRFGHAAEGAHGGISGILRESRALFDELSSGRTKQSPGTMALLASRIYSVAPAAFGAVAGVAALVGGLGYLIVKAMETRQELDQAFLGAQFAGNLEISRATIEQYAAEMAKASNITQGESREIAASLSSIPGVTTPIFRALTAEVSDFARLTGKDAPKAAEELAKAFNAKTSAAEFARGIGGVTQAQINMAEAADRSGNAIKEQEAKLSILLTTIGRSTSTIDENNNKITSSWRNWLGYAGALASGTSMEEVNTDMLARSNKEREKQAEILRKTTEELRAAQQSPEQALKVGVSVAEKENPIALQVEEAKSKIGELNAALAVAKDRGDKVSIDKLDAGLSKANEDLSRLQFGPVLERMREQISQVAATWDGSQSGMLAKQAQIARSMLANVQKNSKEELAIRNEEARLEIQQRRAVGAEAIASAREQATALSGDTSGGPIQRLQAERQVWSELLAGDRLTARQRIEVQRTVAQETAQIAKESAAQQTAIARSDAETDVAIAKINIEAKRGALELDVQENRVSAAQKLQILRDLAAQELALDLQSKQSEIATMSQGTAEYERVLNQERELKARQVLQLEQYDRQYAAEVARQKREEVTMWRSAVGEIENAEGSLIGDIINGRRTLSQSLLNISAQVVAKEIENDVKGYTTKVLLNNSEKALSQGGLLYHLLFSNQEVAATTTAEAAKTSAVTSGAVARAAVSAGAATAAAGEQAVTGPAQVMADAAVAAAGAFAATAAIPYVGPELAPAAAATAYSAVATFAPLAALATGTNYVPRDMVAQIHQGEAVVPKQYNPAAGGAAPGGGKSTSISLTANLVDTRGLQQALKNGGALHKTLLDLHRRGARG